MDTLPIDLLLDISEYTPPPRERGRYSTIGVSSIDIISRIRIYEPTFDYNEWREKLLYKEDILGIRNTPAWDLYQLIQDYNSSNPEDAIVDVVSGDIPPYAYPSPFHGSLNTQIYDLLGIGYTDIAYRDTLAYDETSTYTMYIKGVDGYDIAKAVAQIEIQDKSGIVHVCDMTSEIRSILEIPDTLEEYLIFVVDRARRRGHIQSLPLYPLYDAIGGSWSFRYDPFILHITYSIDIPILNLMVEPYRSHISSIVDNGPSMTIIFDNDNISNQVYQMLETIARYHLHDFDTRC